MPYCMLIPLRLVHTAESLNNSAVNSYKIKSIGTSDPEQLGCCYDQKTILSAEALTDRFLKTWTDTVKTSLQEIP